MAWRWYEMTDKNEVITIPDKGLEEAIKYELNLNPNCEITKDNIKSLRWLDASNKGILDLTGLDNAINLEELYLGYNQIEDISTLSELTNLKILNLSNNQIQDIKVLSDLINS
nr:leucine-rich repeat domain-containing protein [uncultured Romboutsia sp.]